MAKYNRIGARKKLLYPAFQAGRPTAAVYYAYFFPGHFNHLFLRERKPYFRQVHVTAYAMHGSQCLQPLDYIHCDDIARVNYHINRSQYTDKFLRKLVEMPYMCIRDDADQKHKYYVSIIGH